MVSRENRAILFAILVLVPISLFALSRLERWYDVPLWTGSLVLLGVGVLLPQLYLWYTSEKEAPTE